MKSRRLIGYLLSLSAGDYHILRENAVVHYSKFGRRWQRWVILARAIPWRWTARSGVL